MNNQTATPHTLFEKVWDNHLVRPQTPDTIVSAQRFAVAGGLTIASFLSIAAGH